MDHQLLSVLNQVLNFQLIFRLLLHTISSLFDPYVLNKKLLLMLSVIFSFIQR